MSLNKYTLEVIKVLRNNELKSVNLIDNLKDCIYCVVANNNYVFQNHCFNQLSYIINTLYKSPGMIGHLAEWIYYTYSIHIDCAELENLLNDEYIIQIGKNCKLDQAVRILKRFEDRKQWTLSEKLLDHRPIFMLDNSQDILHPYVYTLLIKYNMLIYQQDMEPEKKEVLINYFTKHYYKDSAKLVQLLSNM